MSELDPPTIPFTPVVPARPIAGVRAQPAAAPVELPVPVPPSRIPTQPSGLTISPGELEAMLATSAVQAVDLAAAKQKAAAASDDTDITINLQKTVSRLKAVVAGIVLLATGAITVLNWYGDQRVAAAAEEERKLQVGKALETISTQHTLDQASNKKTHVKQDRDMKALGVLQSEQGKDTRTLLLEIMPEAKKAKNQARPSALDDAEAAVLNSGNLPAPPN